MDTGMVSVRYAKALLKFAIERKEEDTVYEEMSVLSKVYIDAPKLHQMTENPMLSSNDKLEMLCKAVSNNPCESVKRFFNLIIEKRRTESLQFIANSYVSLYLSYKKIIKSRLIVSSKINDELAAKMQKIVEHNTNSKVEMTVEVNPSIGGGFILEYGTYRIDASVNNQIKNIRKNLMHAAGNV